MVNVKKYLVPAVVFIMACGTLVSCKSDGKQKPVHSEKLKIVCAEYPVYDWVKNIVEDYCDVELLVNSGTDLHSWQPSAKDIMKITGKETHLFIYNGGESDFWVNKLIPQMDKNGVAHLSVMETHMELLEPLAEDHDHEHEEDHCGFDAADFDEHIWLSLKRAPVFIEAITEKICKMNICNEDVYRANSEKYSAKLTALYQKGLSAVEKVEDKTIVIADRNPFNYLITDLGLKSYTAFNGCSADTEASFDVVVKLTKVMNDLGLTKIAVTETGNTKLAETILKGCSNKSVEIKVLNALQGPVTKADDYYSIMEHNIDVIKTMVGN